MKLVPRIVASGSADEKSSGVVLEELYEKHAHQVFHLALRYGGGRASWAEDVTHDVFLRLLDSPVTLRDLDQMEAWFHRVTTRRCLNRLRNEAFARSTPVRWVLTQIGVSASPTPEAEVLLKSELRAVADALQLLPPKERVAFCMLHLDGMNQLEIGHVMGHSKGYVSKLIHRAATRLRAAGWEVADE